MLRVVYGRLVVFAATLALGMTASTAMAQHGRGGVGHGGHHHHSHGHRYSGSNFYGRGLSGFGYPGFGYPGFGRPGFGYPGFGYSGWGFPRGGLSISIGSGYPYYRGSLFDDYGFGGYGYRSLHSGYPYYGHSSSFDSLHRRYAPYDLGVAGQSYRYASPPNYEYGYNQVPQADYVYPDRSRPFSPVTPSDPRYSVSKPVASTSDLRPGMVLPDGSTVISVGPLESTVAGEAIESLEPAEAMEIDQSTAEEELQAPVESDDSAEPTEL